MKKKIFSLVLYKNLYPEDFAKLQNNKGYLYDVLQSKSKVVDKVKKVGYTVVDEKQDLKQNVKLTIRRWK